MNASNDDRLNLIADAATRAAAYLARSVETGRPVFPDEAAIEALAKFAPELPEGPADPATVLALLDDVGSPATVDSTGGRYFGFVTGGSEPVATAATMLAAAWDQNVALPVMSPVGSRLDEIAADWVCRLLHLPDEATAAFCSGASIANLTCVLAARDTLLARAGWDVGASGLGGAPPLKVVTGEEVHVSALRALTVAGFGRDAITYVPTDGCGRVIPEHMPTSDPLTLVVLQAGNVNTGHSDPFDQIIPAVQAAGGWIHIDGAFGLWAAAAPERRAQVTGAEQADSWATDAHKWLNAPYDAGIAICARGEDLRRSMAVDAAYLPADGERAPMHLGLQMSQRARGIETWALIATMGRAGLAALIERSCQLTTRFARTLVDAGVEILAPVVLNQALASFGDDATTDAVIEAVQREGTCWAGGTTWQGRRAMRLSVSNSSTTEQDIDRSAAAIVDSARRLARGAVGNP